MQLDEEQKLVKITEFTLLTMPPRRKKKAPKTPKKPEPQPWDEFHPARKLLYEELANGNIKDSDLPAAVWQKYRHTAAFMTWGMEFNANFGTRLRSLKLIVSEGKKRAVTDAKHFEAYRQVHPRPATDRRGDPFWDGSQAQEMLNVDMNNNKHKTMTPRQLYDSKELYQQWSLEVFRGHIHQESDTRKYLYTLKKTAQELADEKAMAETKRWERIDVYEKVDDELPKRSHSFDG